MTTPVPAGFEYPTHREHRYLPNFWGDHYTQLPDIYHRFALSTDEGVEQLDGIIPLTSLRVLDLGAGTGRSAFAMARRGAQVIGLDPEPAMRDYALQQLAREPSLRVECREGSTSRIPGQFEPFDLVTSFHAPFAPEGKDVVSRAQISELIRFFSEMLAPGGSIAVTSVIPGWTHEWMQPRRLRMDGFNQKEHTDFDEAMRGAGFVVDDKILEYQYASLEEALATYGFIYGPQAIDWLLGRALATVYFGNRIYLWHSAQAG